MAIDLILNALQSLTGSTLLQDKVKRSETVIKLLKQFNLDPDHPPADYEGVYQYALVEYGTGKVRECLEIFRAKEIRRVFRSCFDAGDGVRWLAEGEAFLVGSDVGVAVAALGLSPRQELAEFAGVFLKVARRSQHPKETLLGHQLKKIEQTIDRRFEQLGSMVGPGALVGANPSVALAPSVNCRAAGLAEQMRAWFETLGYRFESHERWEADGFEWIINIPVRRGRYDRVLVRGMDGEVGIRDVRSLSESMAAQKTDEGWVVTMRRVSQAARAEVERAEGLAAFTLDELLDQEASFELYLDWLEAEIGRRGIEARYVPIACTKEEVDPLTHQRLGVSRYGEADGWTEGYIDRWLDDPVKEHLSVLGEFGTGKTWLTLHYAAGALRRYREAQLKGMARPRLPIVIPLRDYAKAVSVESLFSEFFFRQHKLPIPHYDAFIQLNRMGKLLLIFDGFDEMAARVDKQQMINNFWELAKVVVPGSKVILTCRTEHFPEAREGRSLLNAELQASTRGLSGETPQFEVLELEKFEDEQIRRVLGFSASEETVGLVMGNAQLLDLARRPVMTELILEALPDIEAGKPVDMSRVYLYAVRRKMERDIKAERTFTSMADKLYFLCELSWEMLSNDRMSMNYREFPDRIRKLFGAAVQEEKDLDHWHFDMMGQTMLIRNAEGDYTPAHRSLLEFFVAFKFAAELGALAPDFLEVAQMKSGIDHSLEPREYTWSEYFGGGAVAPLLGFRTEGLEGLRSGFGKEVLAKAIIDLLETMLQPYRSSNEHPLIQIIGLTQDRDYNEVRFVGGNSATLLNRLSSFAFYERRMDGVVLCSADFALANLRKTNFSNTNLKDAIFSKTSGGVFSAALSLDGRYVITGDNIGKIYAWDTYTSTEIFVFKGHSNAIRALTFSKKSKTFISAAADGKIKIWDFRTQTLVKVLEGHDGCVMDIVLSADGTQLVSSSADKTIKLWDMESGKCLKHYLGHKDWVRSIAFNLAEGIIVSAGDDNVVMVWDIDTCKCILSIPGPRDRIYAIDLSHCGKFIAVGSSDGNLQIWNLNSNLYSRVLKGHIGGIACVKFVGSQNDLVSTSYDKSVKIWNIENGECKQTLIGHQSYWIHSIGSHENRILMTTSPQELKVWNLTTGSCINTLNFRQGDINDIAYHPIEDIFVSTSADKSIKIWDAHSGECVHTLDSHKRWTSCVSFNHSGNLIASGSHDFTIRIWDIKAEDYLYCIHAHKDSICAIAFSMDDKYLISTSDDASIKIWSVDTGKLVVRTQDSCGVKSLSSHPYEPLFATGNMDGQIKVWDLNSGEQIFTLKGHTDWIRALKFSPCGKFLISGSSDCMIMVWDIQERICISILKGHTDWIDSVTFGKSHNIFASGSFDGTIRLWDINKRECFKIFSGESDPILSVSFSPDCQTIVSGCGSGVIRIWDVASETCIREIYDRPYEGMNITGVKGLNESTIASLKALGAIEDEEVGETVE